MDIVWYVKVRVFDENHKEKIVFLISFSFECNESKALIICPYITFPKSSHSEQ